MILTSLVPLLARAAPDEAISVVVNQTNGVATLDAQHVSDFFLGRRLRWAKEVPVLVVIQDGDLPLHEAFCEQVIGLSAGQVETRLLQLRYQGGAGVRIWRAKSEAEARQKVAENPGAIAYLRGKTAGPPLKIVFTTVP